MAHEIGTGIDDDDVAMADDVRPGAVIGELRRVLRDDPTNQRRHLLSFP